MKSYQFILVLKNVDEDTENLEDSLYEAGCDDALINFRNGSVYLDFDRQAPSMEEAVLSAIKSVESSTVKAKVVYVAPENLVTESDIAKRLDKSRQTVSLWIKGARRNTKPFPRPVMKLSEKSPFWKWREIAQWLYAMQLIQEEEIVKNAEFIEAINIVLEEREPNKTFRQGLLRKLESQTRLLR